MAKTVLITGAARRIGAACVRLLHASGWNVLLHYHQSASDALALAAELNALRDNSVIPLSANLAQAAERRSLADGAIQAWGRLDALVNNASLFSPSAFGAVDEADWDNLMATNLKSPYFLSQALSPALMASQGCVINITDIHAETGLPGYSVYSIAKAGLVSLTQCLAKELAPVVRVNAVAPGAILWPESEIIGAQQMEILSKVALKRLGEPEDIARAVRFMLEDAGYITGQVISVDGGRTLNR